MKHTFFGPLVALGLALAGCSTSPEPAPEAPAIGNVLGATPPVLKTRGLAGPSTYLGPLPSAFILLKKTDSAKNRKFCDAWFTGPTTSATLRASPVRPNIVETDWLINTDNPSATTCDVLLKAYDYPRADRTFAALAKAAAAARKTLSTSGAGPFVVIVVPGVDSAGGTIVIDGSTETDMMAFVKTYQARIDEAVAGMNSQSATQAPATASPAGAGEVKKPYRDLFELFSRIIESIWPVTGTVITVIRTLICP